MTEAFFEVANAEPAVRYHRRSGLTSFACCPFAYKYVVDHPNAEANEATALGIEGHKLMADYLNELRHEKEWAAPDYLISEAEKSDPAHAQELTDILRKAAFSIRYPPNDILAVERTFKTTKDMPPGQGYGQTLDLLWRQDEVLCVDDWKFGFKVYSDSDARAERQSRWACWLLSVQPEYAKVELFRFRFRMMRFGGMTGQATFRRDQLASVPLHIGTAILELLRAEGGEWPAKPGDHCAWCSAIGSCPLAASASPGLPFAKEMTQGPEAFARATYVLDCRVDAMKKALKAYCAERGPVGFDGRAWGIERSEQTRFDCRET